MSWRAIQDSVPHSETLAAISSDARSLFWNLLAISDPWGRGRGSPAKVRAQAVPLFDWELGHVEELMAELVAVGRLVLYADGGEWYFELADFDKHQPREYTRRRAESAYPAPPADVLEAAQEAAARVRSGNFRQLPAKKENEKERVIKAAVASYEGALPISKHDGLVTWQSVAASLADADERTAGVIAAVSRGLPQAALHTALESLELRRNRPPELVSECRYFVSTLKRMREEGQYA